MSTPKKTRKKPLSVLTMLNRLRHPKNGVTLYEILFRNAGCGLLWHEESRGPHIKVPHSNPLLAKRGVMMDDPSWKNGLIVYKYYPTFSAAVKAEYNRFFGKERNP